MATNTIKLSNGKELPKIGLGTFSSPPGIVGQAIQDAIELGYRHLDCAWYYGNEAQIGMGIRAKIVDGTVKREDLFITTKLWNNFHSEEEVVPKLTESLKSLQLDYIDLFLIHWPFAFKKSADLWPKAIGKDAYSDIDYLETWKGMEKCISLGLAKSIGLSNFNEAQLDRLLANCTIKPVVNQVEVHVNLNQKKLIEFCRQREIVVTAYCPLGRAKNEPGKLSAIFKPEVAEIGKKYNKSPAQVVLNYLISLGISVIPKSVSRSRIKENMEVFDFVLDTDDVQYLDSCECNMRVCGVEYFNDHLYFPF